MGEAAEQEGRVHLAAAFDQKARDPFETEHGQQPSEIDVAVLLRRDDHADALRERGDAFLRSALADEDRGHPGGFVGDEPRRQRRAGARVEHEPPEFGTLDLGPGTAPHRQRRIVGEHGPDADEDGVGTSPEALAVGTGAFAGDPLRPSVRGGDLAVERHRGLHGDEGRAVDDPVVERLVHPRGSRGEQAAGHLDPLGTQQPEAAAGVPRVRIGGGHDHFPDPRGHDGIGTRRRAPEGRARFQRDEQRGALRRPAAAGGITQRLDLGVRMSGAMMPALAYDPAAVDEHRADQRVRRRPPVRAPGQAERQAHGLRLVDLVCRRCSGDLRPHLTSSAPHRGAT